MSERLPRGIAHLPHQVRERLAELPDRWRTVREGLRKDPARLWHSPVTRVLAIAVILIAAAIGVVKLTSALTPGGKDRAEKPTAAATVYVACTNPACRASHTAHVPRDFKAWPLKCDKCGQQTAFRATLCRSCRQWFAVPPGAAQACPFCAEREQAAAAASRPAPRKTGPDDEDPW